MTHAKIRVGIVGLNPERSWAAHSHLPALRALESDYEIAGVANSCHASAQAAAQASGITNAFENTEAMFASPEIDLVTIAVKVPHHRELVERALLAGKHVYCEWPLGNGLKETEELAGLARSSGKCGVVGLQAPFAPEIIHMRRLIEEKYIGDILSITMVGSGLAWGGEIDQSNAYLFDIANGATMLTIPLAHALSGVCAIAGEITVHSAMIAHRRTNFVVVESGEKRASSTPDQILVQAFVDGEIPMAIHYRGGNTPATGFLLEINGTEGDICLKAPVGHPQMMPLSLSCARVGEQDMREINLSAPDQSGPIGPAAVNVSRVYKLLAQDIRKGTQTAPSFDDAVAMYRLIDEIERAAARTG